jgi:hypothetical protein
MEDRSDELSAANLAGEKSQASDGARPTPIRTAPTQAEGDLQTLITPGVGTIESGQIEAKPQISAKKVEANRKNAQKSTGPKTETGKARSAANSYKHGFFAKRLFQTPEQAAADKADYLAIAEGVMAHYQPVGFMECLWAEKIATELLRLARVVGYEQKVMGNGSYPYGAPAAGNILRYQTAGNRLLTQAIEQLDRLQAKRRALEGSPEEARPTPDDTTSVPNEPSEQPASEEKVEPEL